MLTFFSIYQKSDLFINVEINCDSLDMSHGGVRCQKNLRNLSARKIPNEDLDNVKGDPKF